MQNHIVKLKKSKISQQIYTKGYLDHSSKYDLDYEEKYDYFLSEMEVCFLKEGFLIYLAKFIRHVKTNKNPIFLQSQTGRLNSWSICPLCRHNNNAHLFPGDTPNGRFPQEIPILIAAGEQEHTPYWNLLHISCLKVPGYLSYLNGWYH